MHMRGEKGQDQIRKNRVLKLEEGREGKMNPLPKVLRWERRLNQQHDLSHQI